jgi:hypothetical protein
MKSWRHGDLHVVFCSTFRIPNFEIRIRLSSCCNLTTARANAIIQTLLKGLFMELFRGFQFARAIPISPENGCAARVEAPRDYFRSSRLRGGMT